MKLMLIVTSLKKTGPTEVVYNMISNMRVVDSIYLVQLFHDPSSKYNFYRFSQLENVEIITLFKGGKFNSVIRSRSRFRWLINNFKPDVIHSHCLLPDLFSALYLRKEKIVTTCHNNPIQDYQMKFGSYLGKVISKLQYWSFRRFEVVYAISKNIQKVLKTNKLNSTLVYNGIREDLFFPIKDGNKINDLKIYYDIPTDKKVIISVASLIDRKNPVLLLESFIQAKLKETCIVFVGSGPLEEQLKLMSAEHQDVFLLGHQSKVHELLNISDLFVSISKSEGFGLNVAEAAAVGLPMILSDIEPYREQSVVLGGDIRKEKVSFVNLDLKNSQELLITELQGAIGRMDFSDKNPYISEYFKSSKMANTYLDGYQQIT